MWFRVANKNTAAPVAASARQTTTARLSRAFLVPAGWAGCTPLTGAFMDLVSIAIFCPGPEMKTCFATAIFLKYA
jgi:hypothetical protein